VNPGVSSSRPAPTRRSRWLGGGLALVLLAFALGRSVAGLDRLAMIGWAIGALALVVGLDLLGALGAILVVALLVVGLKRFLPALDAGPLGVLLDALLVLAGLQGALTCQLHRAWRALNSALTVPVSVFVGALLLEALNPLAPSMAFGLWGSRDTLRWLGFPLALLALRSGRALRGLCAGVMFALAAESLYGIFQHHHGLHPRELQWMFDSGSVRTHLIDGHVRVFGTVGDAATFGFLAAIGVWWSIGLATRLGGAWRPGLVAIALVHAYAMLLSYSRGPVAATLVGLIAMVAASRRPWPGLLAMGMAGGGLGLASLAGEIPLLSRALTAVRPQEDASFLVRMGYLQDAWGRIVQRPFGSGLWTAGASGFAITGGRTLPGTTIGMPTDNNYFKWALEIGWVGVSLFLWLEVAALVTAWQAARTLHDPFCGGLALALVGTVAGLMVGAVSNDIFVQKPLAEFYPVALGLVAVLSRAREERRPA
jgi:putative inorganic carbon (HCO3(-)) transporter